MEIMKVLEQINAMGTTIIMATHDRDIVDRMKRRVLVINNGMLVGDYKKGRSGRSKCSKERSDIAFSVFSDKSKGVHHQNPRKALCQRIIIQNFRFGIPPFVFDYLSL